MPEGHSIRHLANLSDTAFKNKKVTTTSPQGRFAEEAAVINQKEMTGAGAHGKHLFLRFGDEHVVHVHLGLYGWFHFHKGQATTAKDTTRLRLEVDDFYADLIAPTACELLLPDEVEKILQRLGPDPIHQQADPEQAWNKIKKSSKSIAALLMDQSVIAGIGNVYRAELLFRSNTSPFIPGSQIDKEKFESIWKDSVELLKLGAVDGKIRTVKTEHMSDEEIKVHGCSQNSYVYKQTGGLCRICSDTVKQEKHAGRELYWCPTCQS
jgi:DNA-formamidopyrimidine glycosylase